MTATCSCLVGLLFGTDILNSQYDMLKKAGLRDGSNPKIPNEKYTIVQDPFYDMGVFRFDEDGFMYLETVHPGHTVEQIKEECSFALNISKVRGETKPPNYHELDLLYKEVDPEGIFVP